MFLFHSQLGLLMLIFLSFMLLDNAVGFVDGQDPSVAVDVLDLFDGGSIEKNLVAADTGDAGSVPQRVAGGMVPVANEHFCPCCEPNRTTSSGFSCRRTASRRDSTRLESKLPILAVGGPDGELTSVILERSASLRRRYCLGGHTGQCQARLRGPGWAGQRRSERLSRWQHRRECSRPSRGISPRRWPSVTEPRSASPKPEPCLNFGRMGTAGDPESSKFVGAQHPFPRTLFRDALHS